MPTPTPLTIPVEAIEEIWQKMLDLMGDDWANTNAFVSKDATATNYGYTLIDKAGQQLGVNRRLVFARVLIDPISASLGPGDVAQFSATVTKPDGTMHEDQSVVWSLQAPARGTLSATGLYNAPGTYTAGASDMVIATHSDGGMSTAQVSLHP